MSFSEQNKTGKEARGSGESGVRSVETAMRLLELLAERVGPVRVTDIALQLSLGKPRVCRHLATLEAMGLVGRVGRHGYTVGERFKRMALHGLRERTVGEMAIPALEALRDELGQTVVWAVPADEGAVVLNCVESPRAETIHVRAGTVLRYPYSPAARLARALGGGGAAPGSDAVLRDALARWRSLGVDFEIDTQLTGLGGICAPVLAGATVVGLVSLVVPSSLLTPEPSARTVQALLRCVRSIQERIQA